MRLVDRDGERAASLHNIVFGGGRRARAHDGVGGVHSPRMADN